MRRGKSFLFGRILLCLALSGVFLCAYPQVAFPLWTDEGKFDISWYDGSGSYTISTASQLAGISYLVESKTTTFEGETITLGADIDLSGDEWRPIGTNYDSERSSRRFMGIFDGQNHKIVGLTISNGGYYCALFGSVAGSTLKDFEVYGSVTGEEYCAGVCACAEDSSFINIFNHADVTATYPWNGFAAGVVCSSTTAYPTKPAVFEKLSNDGNINATSYHSGGIIGFLYSAPEYETTVRLCANYGSVTISRSKNVNSHNYNTAGGVIGATATYGTYRVTQCLNAGSVSAQNLACVGGITGFLGGAGSSVSSSYNTGSVSGPDLAGGIVGRNESDGIIRDCYSSGQISG